jgi:molecular chaperone DnaK (HSP70)
MEATFPRPSPTKFEELNMDLFKKTMKPVEQVLKGANVKEDIDEVGFPCKKAFS